jgi:flavodoxin/NAD-dependent dihydropyrimidine dehydrogenase PreA subunit
MSKALIVKFSQTGTTTKVAESIAKGLSVAGWKVDLRDVIQDGVPDLGGYDLLGIGSPTHFYRAPFVVQDLIRSLPALHGMASFVFVLHGTHQGDCGNWIRTRLRVKGATDVGYFRCFGADYWLGYLRQGYLFSPDSPTGDELAAAEVFGQRVAQRYGTKAPDVEAFDGPTPLMYRIERFLARRLFVSLMYSRTFRADGNCDGCGICVEMCPVDNIVLQASKRPRWRTNCLLCAACELACPKEAIHSGLDWPIVTPLTKYNIRKAIKTPYPYAQVEHRGGEMWRV